MKNTTTNRGFQVIEHPNYPKGEPDRLLGCSSVIGEYEDAFERPGTSALWIGNEFHLYREEVQELVEKLQHWLETGKLF